MTAAETVSTLVESLKGNKEWLYVAMVTADGKERLMGKAQASLLSVLEGLAKVSGITVLEAAAGLPRAVKELLESKEVDTTPPEGCEKLGFRSCSTCVGCVFPEAPLAGSTSTSR